MRIYTASDTHIGAISLHHKYAVHAVANGIHACDVAVLPGDIFEIKSTALEEETKFRLCVEAIDRWARINPFATIYILNGNHEAPICDDPEAFGYCKDFMTRLRKHASQYPNIIFIDEPYLQIGDTLFIHGHYLPEKPLSRAREIAEGCVGPFISGEIANNVMDRDQFITRIWELIKENNITGVKHVCFGHIHQPLENYKPPQLKAEPGCPLFHNLGTFLTLRRDHAWPRMIEQDDAGHTLSTEIFRKTNHVKPHTVPPHRHPEEQTYARRA